MSFKNLKILLLLISFGGMLQARRKICRTEQECINNPQCACYCSRMCGFRNKEANDQPIYIANDPEGKFCYCKPWDYKNYFTRGCDRKK
jgi:hypothetical protein